jgi:hypothetical protein
MINLHEDVMEEFSQFAGAGIEGNYHISLGPGGKERLNDAANKFLEASPEEQQRMRQVIRIAPKENSALLEVPHNLPKGPFTFETAEKIRSAVIHGGHSMRAIARFYGVCAQTIGRMVYGRRDRYGNMVQTYRGRIKVRITSNWRAILKDRAHMTRAELALKYKCSKSHTDYIVRKYGNRPV